MSEKSVWLWTAALALGSAFAPVGTAGATVRTATYTWTSASGPVAGYLLYVSVDGGAEKIYGNVYQPHAVIEVASGASLILRVAPFDALGYVGPASDPSPPLRLCPGDFDGDESIEMADLLVARSCVLQQATGICAGADLNEDGIVTSWDFMRLQLGENTCPPTPHTCRGDMDGDGWISNADVWAIKPCIGLLGQGSCYAADFDGNGFVSTSDWSNASRAIGPCP